MSDYVVPNRLFTKMSCHLAQGYRFDRVCVCGGGGREGEGCVCTCDSRYFMIFWLDSLTATSISPSSFAGHSCCYSSFIVPRWTF